MDCQQSRVLPLATNILECGTIQYPDVKLNSKTKQRIDLYNFPNTIIQLTLNDWSRGEQLILFPEILNVSLDFV